MEDEPSSRKHDEIQPDIRPDLGRAGSNSNPDRSTGNELSKNLSRAEGEYGSKQNDQNSDVKNKEEAKPEYPDGYPFKWSPGSDNKKTVSRRKIFKRAGPVAGISVGLLGLGTLMTVFLSPALLLVQLSETMTEEFNDQLSALDVRSTALLKKKLGTTTTKGICGKVVTIKCKYRTIGPKQLKRLERAGIKPVGQTRNLGITTRTKPTAFEFNGRTIPASELLREASTDSQLRNALRQGYNPKFAGFSDAISIKARALAGGLRKSPELKGNTPDERNESLKKLASGDIEEVGGGKLIPVKDDNGKIVEYEDANGRRYDISTGEALNSRLTELNGRADLENLAKKAAIKNGIRSALTTSALGAGAADSLCTAWVMVRVAGAAAKIYQKKQEIRYAYEFMKLGSQIRAAPVSDIEDQPKPEDVEFFANKLTEPNSIGATATDSDGYKFAAYNDTFQAAKFKDLDGYTPGGNNTDEVAESIALENETAKYVNGQILPKNVMSSFVSIVAGQEGGGSTIDKVDDTCGFVKSWKGQSLVIGLAVVGLAVGIFTGGATFGAGAALQAGTAVTISVAFAILMPKLLATAKGEIVTGNENGNETGNLITSGMGGFNEANSQASLLAPNTKSEYAEYNDLSQKVAADYAETERAERSPFDPTSKHTFVGSIVSSLIPYTSKTKTLGSKTMALSSLVVDSFSSIISKPSIAAPSAEEKYGQCDDPEYEKYDLATDPFCNLRYGIKPDDLSIDPDKVLDYMISNGYISESDSTPQGEYKDYVELCAERKTSIGDKFTDYKSGSGDTGGDAGVECIQGKGKDEERNKIFRLFFIDTRIQDGMDSDFEIGTEADPTTIENTGAGTSFTIATYNQPKRGNTKAALDAITSGTPKHPTFDIIGMQELAGTNYSYLRNNLKKADNSKDKNGESKGYGIYPDWSKASYPRHCSSSQAIFYNKDKFKFIKGEVFDFPRYNDPGSQCDDGESTKNGRANAPVIWLEDVESGQTVIAMNTHNVAFSRNEERRFKAAEIYVQKIENLKKANPGVPIFFTGDFNEGTGVRSKAGTNTTYKRDVNNLFFCISAKKELLKSADGPEMKCNGNGIGGVDYVYVSPEVKVDSSGSFKDPSTNSSPHPVVYATVTVPGNGGGEGGPGWIWPIKAEDSKPGPCFNTGTHAGFDINSDKNSDVYAIHKGKVVDIASGGDRGNYIMIKTNTGIYYAYQHLLDNSTIVKVGQEVEKGEVVAKMGATGFLNISSKAHLHITTSKSQTVGSRSNTSLMINPMNFVGSAKPKNYECY